MEKALLKSICIGLILISSAAFSQTLDTIHGQLFYHNQLPMHNVNVYLKTTNGTFVQSTVTNTAGQYVFDNVAPGNYVISFSTNATAGSIFLALTHVSVCGMVKMRNTSRYSQL